VKVGGVAAQIGAARVYPVLVNREEEAMRNPTRKTLIATALAVAAVVAVAGSAEATKTIKVPSTVSIKSNSLHFTGKVSTAASGKPCRGQRKVVLFKVLGGGPDQAVGNDTTSNNGAWSITPTGSAGITLAHFYAKAKTRSDGAAGTIHICQAAKSKVIGVSNP
jgi:hypothetical protein